MSEASTQLDRRFGTVLAMMQTSPHQGERDAARRQLEEFARRSGLTLRQAIAQHERPAAAPQATNFFAGFDDWMEGREPGYKAKKAADKAERTHQSLLRRADIVARYGSAEKALAPCKRELLLRSAVKPWLKMCRSPHQRWTDSVDGYRYGIADAPEHVRKAIGAAYPIPTTFRGAVDEQSYWLTRRDEIEDVLGHDGFGDDGLDLLPWIRLEMVRKLVETDLHLTSIEDITCRLGLAEQSEVDEAAMVTAVYRDLSAYVAAERR